MQKTLHLNDDDWRDDEVKTRGEKKQRDGYPLMFEMGGFAVD